MDQAQLLLKLQGRQGGHGAEMTVKDRDAHPGGVGQRVDADWLHKIPAQHRHRPADPRRMAVYSAQRPDGWPVNTLQQPVMQLPPQPFA
ncbi:hypothetical protein SB00610_05070 [Klebsiella quasipneumoniae subsp. similipneumoniae]|nr:hypothetical protein SB00610_05070 [Klebsiella quasipneumoniae subsp. similipneumoniae]